MDFPRECRCCGQPLPKCHEPIGVCVWCVKKENDTPKITVKRPEYGKHRH